jgi:hypothetical protein
MPADVTWYHAALTPAELGHRPLHRLSVLDRVLRRHPAGPADGAYKLGPWQDIPGTIYRQIAESLRDGKLPPPIILLGELGPANVIVIEGHKRLTGLLLCPQWLPAELNVLLGFTARHNK